MTPTFFKRALESLRSAYDWYAQLCRDFPQLKGFEVPVLLAANFLALRELVEGMAKSGKLFDIRPYPLAANGEAVRVVDVDRSGRPREVAIWVDSAVGLPDPTIRIGTDAGSANAGGIRVRPGDVNELGVVPPDSTLWMSSDIPITIYVLERG